MSRRSIFVLTATVVLLYFSIIVFMLSPLHGARRGYYSAAHPRYRYCKDLHYRPPGPVVALVSHPGSGNTWLRYLLQQVTGIMTGSIYLDYGLRLHGFPAENVTDGTVLVVKTHEPPPDDPDKFQAAILLIRNPRDAILADFNRLHKGHVGTAPKSAFIKTGWAAHVSEQVKAWQALHKTWLSRFRGRVHVLFYEALLRDPRAALREALAFLRYNVTEDDMTCALLNKEGIYRRRKKIEDFEPYTAAMYRALEDAGTAVGTMISQYYRQYGIADTNLPSYAMNKNPVDT